MAVMILVPNTREPALPIIISCLGRMGPNRGLALIQKMTARTAARTGPGRTKLKAPKPFSAKMMMAHWLTTSSIVP